MSSSGHDDPLDELRAHILSLRGRLSPGVASALLSTLEAATVEREIDDDDSSSDCSADRISCGAVVRGAAPAHRRAPLVTSDSSESDNENDRFPQSNDRISQAGVERSDSESSRASSSSRGSRTLTEGTDRRAGGIGLGGSNTARITGSGSVGNGSALGSLVGSGFGSGGGGSESLLHVHWPTRNRRNRRVYRFVRGRGGSAAGDSCDYDDDGRESLSAAATDDASQERVDVMFSRGGLTGSHLLNHADLISRASASPSGGGAEGTLHGSSHGAVDSVAASAYGDFGAADMVMGVNEGGHHHHHHRHHHNLDGARDDGVTADDDEDDRESGTIIEQAVHVGSLDADLGVPDLAPRYMFEESMQRGGGRGQVGHHARIGGRRFGFTSRGDAAQFERGVLWRAMDRAERVGDIWGRSGQMPQQSVAPPRPPPHHRPASAGRRRPELSAQLLKPADATESNAVQHVATAPILPASRVRSAGNRNVSETAADMSASVVPTPALRPKSAAQPRKSR